MMKKRIRLAIVFSVGAIIVGCGFLTFFSIKNNSNKTRTIKNNVDVTMTSVHLENGEINPDVFYTDSNNGGTIEISNDYFSLDLEKIETQNYSYEIIQEILKDYEDIIGNNSLLFKALLYLELCLKKPRNRHIKEQYLKNIAKSKKELNAIEMLELEFVNRLKDNYSKG